MTDRRNALRAIRNRLALLAVVLLPIFIGLVLLVRASPFILLLPLGSGGLAVYYTLLTTKKAKANFVRR